MKDIVIFDLDGTLADGTHRLHLLPKDNYGETWAWKPFNMACKDDAPIYDNIHLCNTLWHTGMTVIILTGRSDDAEGETRKWLRENNVKFDTLIMRSKHDNRKDIVIKEEVLRAIGLERILCAFDDSPAVIKHFRALGLTTHAVTEYGCNGNSTHLKPHGSDK